MNMDAYWSGFLTAVAIVCLVVAVVVMDEMFLRILAGMVAGGSAVGAAGLSHDARTP